MDEPAWSWQPLGTEHPGHYQIMFHQVTVGAVVLLPEVTLRTLRMDNMIEALNNAPNSVGPVT